jgi:hypothetical protein
MNGDKPLTLCVYGGKHDRPGYDPTGAAAGPPLVVLGRCPLNLARDALRDGYTCRLRVRLNRRDTVLSCQYPRSWSGQRVSTRHLPGTKAAADAPAAGSPAGADQ